MVWISNKTMHTMQKYSDQLKFVFCSQSLANLYSLIKALCFFMLYACDIYGNAFIFN